MKKKADFSNRYKNYPIWALLLMVFGPVAVLFTALLVLKYFIMPM